MVPCKTPARCSIIFGSCSRKVPVPSDAFRGPTTKAISLAVDDLYSSEEAVSVKVGCEDAQALLIVLVTETRSGRQVARITLNGAGKAMQTVDFGRLPGGTYRVRASGIDGGSVSDVFLVIQA